MLRGYFGKDRAAAPKPHLIGPDPIATTHRRSVPGNPGRDYFPTNQGDRGYGSGSSANVTIFAKLLYQAVDFSFYSYYALALNHPGIPFDKFFYLGQNTPSDNRGLSGFILQHTPRTVWFCMDKDK
jgi:hypothetical protein